MLGEVRAGAASSRPDDPLCTRERMVIRRASGR